MIEGLLVNRSIERFEIGEYSRSTIHIAGGYSLACDSVLRCIGDDGAFITNQDHEQWFGLSTPYNAEKEIIDRIVGKTIESTELRPDTGDLILRLAKVRIELISSSAGYENWQLYGPNDFIIVGHGGIISKK